MKLLYPKYTSFRAPPVRICLCFYQSVFIRVTCRETQMCVWALEARRKDSVKVLERTAMSGASLPMIRTRKAQDLVVDPRQPAKHGGESVLEGCVIVSGSQEPSSRIGTLPKKEENNQSSFEEKPPKTNFLRKISSMQASPPVFLSCHSCTNPQDAFHSYNHA